MSYQTFATKDTGFYADTVEWCPLEPYKDILACGTYQLIDKDQPENQYAGRRVGRVTFYRLNDSCSYVLNITCTVYW